MSNNVEIIKANPLVTRRNDNSGSLSRRVAAYCRVSSDSDDQKNSYDSQVRHYREYISQHQDWILVDIYADEGISGTQVGKRQDFQRLISDCLDGKIDYIITKAIARFARNTLDTLKYVRLLKDKQIGVFFEEENIDTLTMDGELLLTILSSVAQQEVENTSAHVKKGLKMKMQRGELIGFQGCLGYDYNQDTKSISINEKEAKIVRYIFERYIDGIGGRAIARELDELGYKTPRGLDHWQDTTVLGIIKNEKYKGDILMGKTFTVDPISKRRLINFGEEDKYYIKNNHDAIISPEIFTQAQEIRLRRSGNKKTIANTKGKRERYSRMYPFSSRLECGFCGTVLSRRSWHSSSEYKKIIWHCTTSIKRGKKYCTHSKGIEEKAIENAFLQSYQQLFYENNNLTEDFLEIIKEELTDDTLKVELTKIVSKLNSLYKKEEKLVSMNLDGKISDSVYEDKFNQIQIEKEKLLEEKVNLEVTLKSEVDIKSRLENFKEILTSQKTLTEFDKDIFESIVEKIIVGGINSDGEIDPAMLTIIFKTGDSSTKDAKSYKSKRKNAKIDNDELCFNAVTDDEKKCTNKENNARRGCRSACGRLETFERKAL
ncbi:recombinase family protein [Streptococcus intermedius]|uniref:recombinase family protein n=1 Tax=Streptococcus intermedius TaxID=1338 RepID=UPI002000F085|nr:recombinase family protein [Streptococcus intermedius]